MSGTAVFVKTWIELAEVDSTNDYARSLVETNPQLELPLLVVAREQTRGRGQGANAWWSDKGSLTFTIALDPRPFGLTHEQEPLLALTAAIAILDAIGRYVPPTIPLGIRWPNDIEAGERKLGGILTERLSARERPIVLIGVGLNVRTRIDVAPSEIRRMAATLRDYGDGPELDIVLAAILPQMESAIQRLANRDPTLPARWAEADLLLNRPLVIDLAGRRIEGVGQGINDSGALIVATRSRLEILHAGRVLR